MNTISFHSVNLHLDQGRWREIPFWPVFCHIVLGNWATCTAAGGNHSLSRWKVSRSVCTAGHAHVHMCRLTMYTQRQSATMRLSFTRSPCLNSAILTVIKLLCIFYLVAPLTPQAKAADTEIWCQDGAHILSLATFTRSDSNVTGIRVCCGTTQACLVPMWAVDICLQV